MPKNFWLSVAFDEIKWSKIATCYSILLFVTGIGIMYAVMSLCGTTIYSLLPIVIIEQIGKESLVTVLGIFYVYQAMAFIVSTLVASKFIIIV